MTPAEQYREAAARRGLDCEEWLSKAAGFVAACEWLDAHGALMEAARCAGDTHHYLSLADLEENTP